jgi:thymidylate synthase (FAD)
MPEIHLIVDEPTIIPIAEMQLERVNVLQMAEWVKSHRPECVPQEGFHNIGDLLPHDGSEIAYVDADGHPKQIRRKLSDNELLVEIAGRKCYDSFAEKASPKSNREYIENTQKGMVPHASIMYHAKMTFFIAGVSRRVSHELIRNYVGADRDEEGSPSQESTRFTHHYGWYVAHPRDIPQGTEYHPPAVDNPKWEELQLFRRLMQANYDEYCAYIERQIKAYFMVSGRQPTGLDRKRIYEAASQRLDHACETSFVWTTNPLALTKMFLERCGEAADLEFQRFARKWRKICIDRWPNLFVRLQMLEKQM